MSTWRPISRLPKWLSWLPEWTHRPLRWLLRLILVLAFVLFGLAFVYLTKAARFDLDEIAQLPTGMTILDRDGRALDSGWGSTQHLARRQDLPDFLIKALLAREDERFFEHPGVDLRGLLRATYRNVKDWDFTQGASTLTMQLARNTYEIREKSLNRKLLEIALTLRIENRYSKNEILTHYLNRIYFGAGCHGIDEASRTYFAKPVSELNQAQSAMLAGIIRGPHVFSPFRNPDGARDQQEEVLARMVDAGFIDTTDRSEILAQPIRLVPDEQQQPERSYALQAVRRELDRILSDADIREGGLTVRTTLDPSWQIRLEAEITDALAKLEATKDWPHPTHQNHKPGDPPLYLQTAAVTLETKTGAVLALIGGRDYLDSRYNRSTGARRDLGTVYEPWIAAAAAERGKLVLPGKPLLTGRQIGPGEVARIAKRCGITGPFLENEDQFRGSVAATPMELATALATLAGQGRRVQPYPIQSVTNAAGKLLFESKPQLSQALDENAAAQAVGLFSKQDSSRCFTGSTGSDRDAWLLRVGPTGSTVVWFGFDQPERIGTDDNIESLLDDLVTRLAKP